MYKIVIIWILILFIARISSTYDSRTDNGKYIVIKNNKLARILIEKHTELGEGKQTLKKDRKKMSIYGFLLYVGASFIILLTLILLIVPDIPCEPYVIDTMKMYLYVDTFNEKIPIVLTMILSCIGMMRLVVLMFQPIRRVEYRWLSVLLYVLFIIIILVCGACAILFLYELANNDGVLVANLANCFTHKII